MISNEIFSQMIDSPVRQFRGRVEFYEGSTLALICGCHDSLKNFTVERLGDESKFFGYGICQKVNVHLVDKNRQINLSTDNTIEIEYGVGNNYIYPCPVFYITEVNRDEKTNELSITGYDALYRAAGHTVSELSLANAYTIAEFTLSCATLLGLPLVIDNIEDDSFNTFYEMGANFDGTESIREALDAVAEATQTIYYVDKDWNLVFKRLDIAGEPLLDITKAKYFELESGANRRLATITHATELGDNVSISTTATGSTQYVRDNPFWDLRDDIGTLLDSAIAAVGGLTINQFSCSWRGNFLLEIGDKISLTTKDDEKVYAYLLNDSMSFDGSSSQETQWSYTADDTEDASNPSSIGDALKQTFARVDKANRRIDLVASETTYNSERISSLEINTDSINASVSKIEETTSNALESLNNDVTTLTSRVDASVTAEDVQIQISSSLANGVEKVVTTTGFTFNDEGLTVSKSGSEMTTTITEGGMTVYRNEEAVLVADNEGVKAEDLHATTYLIIGLNSRFEDYGDSRTGCFWIGG